MSEIDLGHTLVLAAALLAAGCLGGVLAGLLGVGGGIVVVPVMFHVFTEVGIDPAVKMYLAVGTSLATIIPNSIVSARAHWRRGSVDRDMLRAWAPSVFVGVLIGGALAGPLQGVGLTGLFAVVALIVALHMALAPPSLRIADAPPRGVGLHGIGSLVGAVSALMGIGGGTLSVPILSAFNYPILRAVGTASALGIVISIPGTIAFVIAGAGMPGRPILSVGYVSLIGFALIVPATLLTAPFGVRLAHRISTKALRRAFAVFLALTAARMFYSLWG